MYYLIIKKLTLYVKKNPIFHRVPCQGENSHFTHRPPMDLNTKNTSEFPESLLPYYLGSLPGTTNNSLVFIEGGIGAGKTTIGKFLVWIASLTNTPLIFIDEPFNHDKFREYVADQKNKALDFQKSMLAYRLQVLTLAKHLMDQGWFVVLDRSLYGDRVMEFVNWKVGNITSAEHIDYLNEFATSRNAYDSLLQNAQVIYIPQTQESMIQRIRARDRVGEVDGYMLDYLNLIRDVYDK